MTLKSILAATISLALFGCGAGDQSGSNGSPVANTDNATTLINTSKIINVIANDVDGGGTSLLVIAVGTAAHGQAVNNYDGTVTYTPVTDYIGSDSFSYTISDGTGSSSATVNIVVNDVNPNNTAPVANDDSGNTAVNTSVTLNLIANDTDADGDALSVTSLSNPGHGTVVNNYNGTVMYTPSSGYIGTDNFNYTLSDGQASAIAQVTINVGSNTVAYNDTATTDEDTSVIIAVLSNDVDVDGDVLTIGSIGSAANGTITNNGNGTLTYVPNSNFYGTDTFSYTATDGTHNSTATVSITVNAVNDAPMPRADNLVAPYGATVLAGVLVNDLDVDGDTLSITSVDTTGTLGSVINNNDGTLSYTAPSSYTSDSFKYTVSDGVIAVQVTVSIAPPNTIAAGEQHSLVIKPNGSLWAWGTNYFGELGDGTTTDTTSPVQVVDQSGVGLDAIVAVDSGTEFSIALKGDGTVLTWGRNSFGQLGNNDKPVDNPVTQQVVDNTGLALDKVVAITTDYSTNAALRSDGSVWTWGYNGNYQLGDGSYTDRAMAAPVMANSLTPLSDVMAVAAGSDHFIALKKDSTVWAWGNNTVGQTGDGKYTSSEPYPVQVVDSSGNALTDVVKIFAGASQSFAIQSDGTLWAWGYNNYGQLGDGTTFNSIYAIQVTVISNVVSVTASYGNTYVVKSDGTVWAWGFDVYGQLGNNDAMHTDSLYPVQVVDGSGTPLINVTTISASGFSAFALDSNGLVWAWGYNYYGQLGTTVSGDQYYIQPTQMNTLLLAETDSAVTDEDVAVLINVLANDTVASGATLSVTGVSAAQHGLTQLNGDGTITYTPFDNYNGADQFTYQLSDGTMNTSGQVFLIMNPVDDAPIARDDEVRVAAGDSITIPLLLNDVELDGEGLSVSVNTSSVAGSVVDNGDGTVVYTAPASYTSDSFTYTISDGITAVTGNVFIEPPNGIAAGEFHSLVMKPAGTVRSLGYNQYGQLGDNSTTDKLAPVDVVDASSNLISGVSTVSAGGNYSQLLKEDGTVWAWGDNYYGQLGNGSYTNASTPIQVQFSNSQALGNIQALSTGPYHSVALKNDGTVWSWGYNYYGQLGCNNDVTSPNPVQVVHADGTPFTDVMAVSAGMNHSLALKKDGTVWAWGYNYYGQLGNGDISYGASNQLTPVQVQLSTGAPLTNIVAIDAGASFNVALKDDGTLWVWGSNVNGELGDGTYTSKAYPQQLAMTNVMSISAGSQFAVAVKQDGSVWAWGQGSGGQLGNGSSVYSASPVQVIDSTNAAIGSVLSVSTYYRHVVTRHSDGSVMTWGSNTYGELGTGDYTLYNKAIPLNGL